MKSLQRQPDIYQLVRAHNQLVHSVDTHDSELMKIQSYLQSYAQLADDEKQMVARRFQNIFEILGLAPDEIFTDGGNILKFLNMLHTHIKTLSTHDKDTTERLGRSEDDIQRLEKHVEHIYTLLNTMAPPPPIEQTPTELLYNVTPKPQAVEQPSIHQNHQTVHQPSVNPSDQFERVRQLKPSGRVSDGRIASGEYDEYIRLCRTIKPRPIDVQSIADDIGVSKVGVERRITRLKQRRLL